MGVAGGERGFPPQVGDPRVSWIQTLPGGRRAASGAERIELGRQDRAALFVFFLRQECGI